MTDHLPRPRRAVLLALLPLAGCAATPDQRAGERGIGGTGGIADRGIGGTGIVGTVTAFGSIWVNGRRIAFDRATAVTWEGQPVGPDSMQLGAVVAALARPARNVPLLAESIDLRVAVAGPVQQLLADGGLMVLGQRVETTAAQQAGPPPQPGDWVAVAGLRRPDGTVVASRLDPWAEARGWLVRGMLESAEPGSGLVSGQRFLLGAGLALPAPGSPVRLAGRMTAAGPLAATLAEDPFNPFGTQVTTVLVESFLDGSGRPWTNPNGIILRGTPGGRGVVEARVNAQSGTAVPGRVGPAPGMGDRGAPAGGPGGGQVGGGPGRGPVPGGAPAGAGPGGISGFGGPSPPGGGGGRR